MIINREEGSNEKIKLTIELLEIVTAKEYIGSVIANDEKS